MMEDLFNLTEQKAEDWRVRYVKSHKEQTLSLEALESIIPTSPEEYNKLYGQEAIDNMKAAAGVKVTTKAPKNEYTEALRNLAGIIR
jgi:predicted metalloenzyme YecM